VKGSKSKSPAVDEVERAPVRAPVEPVRDGQAGQHGRDAAAGIEAIERARARARIERHGAGPEAPGRVAAAVVHALGGTVVLDAGDPGEPARVEIERREAVAERQHQAARLTDGEGAHRLADGPAPAGRRRW
jgi:hypothetical protein